MNRGVPVANRTLHNKQIEESNKFLERKIVGTRASIDNSSPVSHRLVHLRRNLKRAQMLEDRYGEIERENRILLRKMSQIMKRKNNDYKNNYRKYSRSLTYDGRKSKALKITEGNQHLLHRIKNCNSWIQNADFERDYKRHVKIAQHLSEYGYSAEPEGRRKKKKRRPKSSAGELATDGDGGERPGSGGVRSPGALNIGRRKKGGKGFKGKQAHQPGSTVPVYSKRNEIIRSVGNGTETRWNITMLDRGALTEKGEDATRALLVKGVRSVTNRKSEIVLSVGNLKEMCADSRLLLDALSELAPLDDQGSFSRLFAAFGAATGDDKLCTQLAHHILSRMRYTQDETLVIMDKATLEAQALKQAKSARNSRLFTFKDSYTILHTSGAKRKWKLATYEVGRTAANGKSGIVGMMFGAKRLGTSPEVRAKLELTIDELKLMLHDSDAMLLKILGRLKVLSEKDDPLVVYTRLSKQFDNNGLEFLSTMVANMLIYDDEEGQLITKQKWEASNAVLGGGAGRPAVGRTGQLIGGEYHFVEARQVEGTNEVVVSAINVHGQSLQSITVIHEGDDPADLPQLEHYARSTEF